MPSLEIVQEIVERLYPKTSQSFEVLESCGIDNYLFVVRTRDGKKLLRISDASEAAFLHKKEFICASEAAQRGVATARYDTHLVLDSWSCLTRDFIESAPTDSVSTSVVWESLGRQASLLHTLPVDGFGYEVLLDQRKFSVGTSTDSLSEKFAEGALQGRECKAPDEHSWGVWISKQLHVASTDDSLIAASILTKREWEASLKVISSLIDWQYSPALCHGDLSPSNIVFMNSNEYRIIDWGNAVAHRVPHFDIGEISVWHDPSSWIAPFASGYGVSASKLKEVVDETLPLQLWRVLWAIRRDLERMKENWHRAPFARRSVEKLSQLKLLLLS